MCGHGYTRIDECEVYAAWVGTGGSLLNEELCEGPGQLAQMADMEEKVWLVNGEGAFNCETWPNALFYWVVRVVAGRWLRG